MIVGSMFPDLEIPIIVTFFRNEYPNNRLVLHSFLGAATLGTILTILVTLALYPTLMKTFFGTKKEYVKVKTALSTNLLVSCLLGNMSHASLDIMTHQSNPVLWPFQTTTLNPVFTNQSSLLVHLVAASLFLTITISNRRNSVDALFVD